MDFQRAAQNRLNSKNKNITDPRSSQGIYARGRNVYGGGSSSAHTGGGPQFGRPPGLALGHLLPGSGREQAPGQNRSILPNSGRNQSNRPTVGGTRNPVVTTPGARPQPFSPDAIRRAIAARRGY